MKGRLFITGMVRSGTTLISRAFDSHPMIVCAPDPCLGFFRSFRNELLRRKGPMNFDIEAPLSDFFFSHHSQLEMYLKANLDIPIEFESLDVIRERLRSFNVDSNATNLVPALEKIGEEKTYVELFNSILGLLLDVYGSEGTQWIGFKQTWAEAFIPALFNTFPDSICLHIIRDPRAMIASWLRTDDLTHDYPLLMILRHWRKSAALASLFSRIFGANQNYIVVRYEDFVNDPSTVMQNICKTMGVPFDPSTTDMFKFRNGSGEQWQTNTSYEQTDSISSKFINKWKERLTHSALQFIEDMCDPEMNRWHYTRISDSGAPQSLLKVPNLSKHMPGETEWIRRYRKNYAPGPINQAKEIYRWYILSHSDDIASISNEELQSILIDQSMLRN